MSVIYVLIPIAILPTALAIYLFFWAVKADQFDDLEKQGFSILFDQDNDEISPEEHPKQDQSVSSQQASRKLVDNTKTDASQPPDTGNDQHDH